MPDCEAELGVPAAPPSSVEKGEEETMAGEELLPRPEDRACCPLMGPELGPPPSAPDPSVKAMEGTGHALQRAGKENRKGRKEEEKGSLTGTAPCPDFGGREPWWYRVSQPMNTEHHFISFLSKQF